MRKMGWIITLRPLVPPLAHMLSLPTSFHIITFIIPIKYGPSSIVTICTVNSRATEIQMLKYQMTEFHIFFI